MEIHQLVHTLSYGDAISGEVLALQRCFREWGCQSEIYTINTHPRYRGSCRSYQELSTSFSGEVVMHYSLGSPLNDLYRRLTRATRTLIHHNITPAHWFRSTNPRIVRDIEQGRTEFPEICRISQHCYADSRFNAREIEAHGVKAEVLELPLDSQKWSVPANSGILSLLRGDPSLHLVHVGRVAPNKCIEDIIKIFHFVHRYVEPKSKLWLIGIEIDTEIYSFGLKRLVHELGLDHAVVFAGQRDDSEVRAFYEAGSVYLCMSEHEGFCLPVLEAMYFSMPVIAFSSSALPDTVGSGGILVTEKRHAELAELAVRACRDPSLRSRMIDAGRQRVAELSLERFAARARELFSDSRSAGLKVAEGMRS